MKKPKGRYWVVFWLAVFLVTASVVVSRQKSALDTAARLRTLRAERGALEARRADLDRRIRTASSLPGIQAKVGALGLRVPADSQSTLLKVVSPHREER